MLNRAEDNVFRANLPENFLRRIDSLVSVLPEFVDSVLLLYGNGPSVLSSCDLTSEMPDARHTEKRRLDCLGISSLLQTTETHSPASYDAIVFLSEKIEDVRNSLETLQGAWLTSRGWVFLLLDSALQGAISDVRDRFEGIDLEPYFLWDAIPKENGFRYVVREESQPTAETAYTCLVFVQANYDPLAHARELVLAGLPGIAFNVLTFVPQMYLANPAVRAAVKAEQALCLLVWDQSIGDGNTLSRFHLAQAFFVQATAAQATQHLAYCVQAEFWHRLHDDDMAARTLRSIQHVSPDNAVAEQLKTYVVTQRKEIPIQVPTWNPTRFKPRVLFVTDNRPNFGLDVLYDGLCQVLGADHVTEFPWKSTLHGGKPERFANYPCCFDYAAEPLTLSQILDRLHSNAFDLVVFGDIERTLDREHVSKIVQASRKIPWVICDMLDDFKNNEPDALSWLGLANALAYFKRECLSCVDYGERAFPLPFSYPDTKIPPALPAERPFLLFWAGQRQFGIRKLALEYLERRLGVDLSVRYPQEEYVQILQSSRIGLDFSGFGFDTVRYWEVPAHGALLLAERRPTLIPFNFRDGESAIFFDDIPDLESKLVAATTDAARSGEIARAGHEWLKRHHTASARARHFLGWIEETMNRYV